MQGEGGYYFTNLVLLLLFSGLHWNPVQHLICARQINQSFSYFAYCSSAVPFLFWRI